MNDPTPPLGIQVLWPLSDAYYISPITPFPRFDYFDSQVGMIAAMLSIYNLVAVVKEIILLSPLVLLAWYVGVK